MMENTLQYKGYFTNIQYSSEDRVLHGKIEGIDDLVTFESESAADIESEFHAAVDDYLAYCEEIGKAPSKTYKGTFNVRISPDLHREIALTAMKDGISLNQAVENAISRYVAPGGDNMAPVYTKLSEISETLGRFSTSWKIAPNNANGLFITALIPNTSVLTKGDNA